MDKIVNLKFCKEYFLGGNNFHSLIMRAMEILARCDRRWLVCDGSLLCNKMSKECATLQVAGGIASENPEFRCLCTTTTVLKGLYRACGRA